MAIETGTPKKTGPRKINRPNVPTITRADLINKIVQEKEIGRLQAAEILKITLMEIGRALAQGNSVKISSFGTFLPLKKPKRYGRNPRTGEEAVISPRRVISFRPSPIFKNSVGGEA